MKAKSVVLVVASLAVLSACIDGDPPEVGRVVVEASPTDSLRLIVSTYFLVSFNEETETREATPLEADTVWIKGNFDDEYSMTTYRRIFVRLRNDTETPEQVRMRILIDGDEDYDVTAQISGGEFMQYLFTSRSAS